MAFLTGHAGRSARIREVCSRGAPDLVSRTTRAARLQNRTLGLLNSHPPSGLTPLIQLNTKYQYPIQNPYHQSASATQAAQFKRLYRK